MVANLRRSLFEDRIPVVQAVCEETGCDVEFRRVEQGVRDYLDELAG